LFVNEPVQSPDEKPVPRPAPVKEAVAKKPPVRRPDQMRSPSIKDALAGKMGEDKLTSKQQHEVFHGVGEVNDFTAGSMEIKWKEFVARLNDRPNLQSTLSRLPRLEDGYRLVLDIDNSVQDDLIASIKPELISWLRTELKNSKVELATVITETSREKIIYTDSEKYLEMLKKNPKLDILKDRFKLDFE
jgi:hypothetical protein